MARFATVIEPDVPITDPDPVVRRARVSTYAGSIAAVMLMVPELLPPISPIRSVPAVTRRSSVCLRESWRLVSFPRSIAVDGDRGAMVTTPPGFGVTRFAASSTASEIILM